MTDRTEWAIPAPAGVMSSDTVLVATLTVTVTTRAGLDDAIRLLMTGRPATVGGDIALVDPDSGADAHAADDDAGWNSPPCARSSAPDSAPTTALASTTVPTPTPPRTTALRVPTSSGPC
ncbi:hypothetical protein [Actinoplanes sp. L3-i22]|uniref:hypothetical protein n=1 Tax=Actinoplanes sp. L3-i22 TaxID=2836373 RepID=UPI001C8503A1|nr:hypothetical protein [Actinoplanes sp. L3-i22]